MIDRRGFLQGVLTTGAGITVLPRGRMLRPPTPSVAAGPLHGSTIPQFVDALPALDVIVAGSSRIDLRMREFRAQVLPTGFPGTWVWGYLQPGQSARASYLGPVIVATRGRPTELNWVNELGNSESSRLTAWRNATDQTLHWADPLHDGASACSESTEPSQPPTGECALHYAGPIPAVAHLHGGEVPAAIDGGPHTWFTSDGAHHGRTFHSRDGDLSNHSVFRYPNSQPAAPLWFHDHTLGLTRLNVYAGLAGAYLITDPGDPPPRNLPAPVPLVIQDRSFDAEGQLAFPAGIPFVPNPEHPFWVPEFIGDTIAVNGKVWPYLDVEPKRYRFLCLNGSNARTYELFLAHGPGGTRPALWQIGTDGGYLDVPARVKRLLLMPGERADVVIDFAGVAPGTRLLLRNTAKAPYPGGESPQGNTTGRVMEFRVGRPSGRDTSYDPAGGGRLRRPMTRLVDPVSGALARGATVHATRLLTLNEVIGAPSSAGGIAYPGGPLEVLVNNTDLPGSPRPDFTPITIGGVTTYSSEVSHEGDTEIWEIANLTADAHPIHLHLVQFQVMNRQALNLRKYSEAYANAFPGGTYDAGSGPPLDYRTGNARALGGNPDVTPFLKRPVKPPAANEAGWKDTVMSPPGQVTRIVVRFAPTDLPARTQPSHASYPFDPDGAAGYVWHCHIIDHEDNEMMRPTTVRANDTPRTYVAGVDY